MESWTLELAEAALHDRKRLEQLLGVEVPDDFPNQPVRDFVLPHKITELQRDPGRGVEWHHHPRSRQHRDWFYGIQSATRR